MTQETLKLALEALEVSTDWDVNATGKQLKSMQAITALRKALAQPEQAPTWWLVEYHDWAREFVTERPEESIAVEKITALYTTPPQRTEQNFCPRCGKRTKDIHTCTPPQRTEKKI